MQYILTNVCIYFQSSSSVENIFRLILQWSSWDTKATASSSVSRFSQYSSAVWKPYSTHQKRPLEVYWVKEYQHSPLMMAVLEWWSIAKGIRMVELGGKSIMSLRSHSTRCPPNLRLNPRTCMTFSLLDRFHLLSLFLKLSVYNFYCTLEKLTSNIGISVPKSRIKVFMRITLQWTFLKLLKRGGRGHAVDGVSGMKSEELVVLCPLCPRPCINLSEGWEDASPAFK